jgi:UDP-N-acetyl-D-galactosamine dehydrogenase
LLGYHPQVILSGRRINDNMGAYIARKSIKLLVQQNKAVRTAKVGILGLAFKENVLDFRNSRVPDIVKEFSDFGIDAKVYDPLLDSEAVYEEYDISLCKKEDLAKLDVLILAVPHRQFIAGFIQEIMASMPKNSVVIDVKSVLDKSEIEQKHRYWSL